MVLSRARLACCLAGALLTFAPGLGQAETITIDLVQVGDAGNAYDTRAGHAHYGAVGYEYWIGKYEVTNAQYAAFLNAVAATDTYGLYNGNMGTSAQGGITQSGSAGSYSYALKSGMENKPLCYVSFYDSLRFINWLHNGQPTGPQDASTTEDGAYAFSAYQTASGRKANALFWMPNNDEWYKAAYYKGGSLTAGYWEYATQSLTAPTLEPPPGATNSANHNYVVGSPCYLNDVGAYTQSVTAYGTFDQNGNIYERTETPYETGTVVRGGSWDTGPSAAAGIGHALRDRETPRYGFRVAAESGAQPIPEPAGITMLLGLAVCLSVMLWRRKGRA